MRSSLWLGFMPTVPTSWQRKEEEDNQEEKNKEKNKKEKKI